MADLTQVDLGIYREPNYEDYQAVVTVSEGLAKSTLSRIKHVGRWVMPFPEKASVDQRSVTVTHSTSSKPSSAEYHSDSSTDSLGHDSADLSVDSDEVEALDPGTPMPFKPGPAADGLDKAFSNTVEAKPASAPEPDEVSLGISVATLAIKSRNQLQNVYRLLAHICNHPVGEKIGMSALAHILDLNPDRIDSIMRFMLVLVHAHPGLAQDLLNRLGYTEDEIVNGDVLLEDCNSPASHKLQNALWNKLEMHFRQIHNAKRLLFYIHTWGIGRENDIQLPAEEELHEAPRDHMIAMLWMLQGLDSKASTDLKGYLSATYGSYDPICDGEIILPYVDELLGNVL